MNEAVLDASALLALLNDEPGADQVAHYIPGAVINAVNLSEVIGKLAESWRKVGCRRRKSTKWLA